MPRQKSRHVDDPVAVGRRIRRAREECGLSQRQLAFPGCSPAYISRIENGERIPSLQLLREIARRLEANEDFLATGRLSADVSVLAEAEIALRLDEMEEAGRLYAAVASEAVDDESRAKALEGLGHIAFREGRPRVALDYYERALALVPAKPWERPELAEGLARAYGTVGELAPAIALLTECVERYEKEADPIRYVRFASLLGYALTDSGDFAGAERIVAGALIRGREVRDPYTRARLYWSQSRLLLEQGRSELAERYARQTLETLRATEDTYAVAHAIEALAHVYLDLGRPDEAIELLREGAPLIDAAGTPIERAHYRIEEARALAALGDSMAAAALAMEASTQLGDAEPLDAGRAYVLLGQIFDKLDEPERASELFELGIDVLERVGQSRYLIEAYRGLAALLKSKGRAVDALELLERAVSVQERAGRVNA